MFIDVTMRAGAAWLDQIDQQIRECDFLIVLLSKSSIDSEMVRAEVARAAEYRSAQGRPQTLPVRVDYEGMLPYAISAFVSPLQYVVWSSPPDDERVQAEILAAIEGRLPERPLVEPAPAREGTVVSDDGRIVSVVADRDQLHPPLPEFDPRFLDDLPTPGGTVKLSDRLYIARAADDRLKREVAKPGTTTIIRAARQTGKSSLLVRGVQHGRERGFKTLYFDFQSFDSRRLASLGPLAPRPGRVHRREAAPRRGCRKAVAQLPAASGEADEPARGARAACRRPAACPGAWTRRTGCWAPACPRISSACCAPGTTTGR